jgi:hypothetical protein
MTLLVMACPKSSGRATLTSAGTTWEVIDGTWKVEGNTLMGSGGHVQSTAEYDDVTIEMDVEQNADLGDRNVGVGLRYSFTNYDSRKTNGYDINWNSRKRINEFVGEANVWKPLHRNWLSSPALQPLNNHLVVRARGALFSVEVNGVVIDTFSDGTYVRGHVSLWVESTRQTVRFANIRLSPR